jgi:FMN reductase [NAD(P)H]
MHYLNETLKVICERASLRSFEDKEIPEEVLNQVLEAGVKSASGGNLQPYSIIKITDKTKMQKLVEAGNQAFIADAPVNLLFCIDWNRTRRLAELQNAPFTADKAFPHFWISFQDTIIAAQSVCTAADSVGLGSVYIGTVPQIPQSLQACKDLLNLPQGVFPVVMVTMGYPKDKPNYRKKFGQNVLIHDNEYKELSDTDLLNASSEKENGRKFKIVENDRRLEELYETARDSMGKDFADQMLKKIKDKGEIEIFQYIFGLHYGADFMPRQNESQIQSIKDSGFGVFDKFIAPE